MSAETFIIEKEIAIEFTGGNELYLSKINVGNGRYLLELVDRNRCIGRRKAHCEKVVDGMFGIFMENYKRQDNYNEAIKIWEYSFALEKNLEFVFVLRVSKRVFDQGVIGQLITKYALKVDSEIEERVGNNPEPMRIALTFPNRKQKFGAFIGHFLKSDFIFHVDNTLE